MEKTINIVKVFERIANTIFVLDDVETKDVVKFFEKKVLDRFNDDDVSAEERIVQLVRYCVEAHDRLLKEIKTTEFVD